LLVRIDSRDARPIYVQIMDEVRRARVLGLLDAEEPLPSVRQLAAELRVNPNTVQQAYRELEREGVVYVRRGQGTYLSPGSVNGVDRGALARGVAERAMMEAHRNGIGAEELIAAIRSLTAASEGIES
jgi:GntR family transcriptional regulator